MEKESNNTIYYVIGAVVFVVIIIIMFLMVKKDKQSTSSVVDDLNKQLEQEVAVPTEDTSAGSINTHKVITKTSSMSYADALVKYKDARIQLDNICQATPNNVTYKNNTSIMLDNRSAMSRSLKIDSVYTIKPYSFKIIKLSSSTLPITWLVDCDKSQNVATILLQK